MTVPILQQYICEGNSEPQDVPPVHNQVLGQDQEINSIIETLQFKDGSERTGRKAKTLGMKLGFFLWGIYTGSFKLVKESPQTKSTVKEPADWKDALPENMLSLKCKYFSACSELLGRNKREHDLVDTVKFRHLQSQKQYEIDVVEGVRLLSGTAYDSQRGLSSIVTFV